MANFIGLIAVFSIGIICFYYEHKEKRQLEHNEWVYSSEKRLRSISDEFERACFDATEEAFEKYSWNIRFCKWHCTLEQRSSLLLSEHKCTIDNLKKDYVENLAEKFSAGYAYRGIDRLPSYLIEEYHQRIEDITFRYHHINFTMIMRIRTINLEHTKTNKIDDTFNQTEITHSVYQHPTSMHL